MKNILFVLMISLLAVSCGQKGEASKAKFKIFSGNIIDPQVSFPGGLLIMGKSSDGSQSFIVSYHPGLELELKKGGWGFATIGWMGTYPMEGNQQCSFQTVEVNSDIFTVNFNMNYQGCLTLSNSEGKGFTDPMFYNLIGGNYNGFKKLHVKTCADIVSCATQSAPMSFRVTVPTELNGIAGSAGVGAGMSSRCISGAYYSYITPPHGGASGFIGMKITTFSEADCNGVPKTYFFDHGFGRVLNSTDGVTIRRGALSVDGDSSNSALALAPINFHGAYSDNTNLPTVSGINHLFLYNGAGGMSPPPYAASGNFIYYDGVWITFAETEYVKLLLQD